MLLYVAFFILEFNGYYGNTGNKFKQKLLLYGLYCFFLIFWKGYWIEEIHSEERLKFNL